MAQLREFYKQEVVPALSQQFGFTNTMRVPKITKVVLNMGLGEALADKKILEYATSDLEQISGQKVVVTKARKSIAAFKVREGWPIGCKVTLRGERMYEFLQRLVDIAIPRIRDFRGLSPKSFDGRGNFAMGVTEQIIFPEIDYDKIDTLRGLDIAITTTAQNDDEGRALLSAMRFPFRGMVTAAEEAAEAEKEAAARKEKAEAEAVARESDPSMQKPVSPEPEAVDDDADKTEAEEGIEES
jgi:large subunit ribosomal protein L5